MISQSMERDHQHLSALLKNLRSALDDPGQTRTFELLDLFWARLAVHIRAENLCLFPALLRAVTAGPNEGDAPTLDEVNCAVETLRSDHNFFMDQLSKAVNMLRHAQSNLKDTQSMINTCEKVRSVVDAISGRLCEHNRLEEEQVYRWTERILSATELDALSAALRYQLKNLPPRFASRNP